jgi:hypothetical protein
MRALWQGVDRPFRLAAAFLRYFSLLANRSIGLCETVRYVVHAGGENISELPCSLETDVSRANGIKALMKRSYWFLVVFALGCAKVLAVREIPQIIVGEPSFFRTIEAHTDAPIVGGNKVHGLLNGAETFPVMLRDIRKAKSTITFAQYLYEDGSIAKEFAEAFAERCRAVLRGIFCWIVMVPVMRLPISLP